MKFIFLTISLLLANTCIFSQNHDVRYKQGNTVASFATPSDIGKMNNYDVNFYKLDVNVERTGIYISGNVEIHAKAVKTFSEFVFELHDSLKIDSVFCNGVLKSFTRNEGVVTVNINGSIPANTGVVCKIYYKGNTPQGGSAAIGNGFSNSASKQVTWSLSESYVAYEWWPCKQVLYDKADSAEIWITTDSANKAGSNGLLKNITLLPNGKKRFEWKTNYPIDYYLISVAVAKYTEYNIYAHPVGLTQPLLIQNYIYDTTVIPVLNYTPWLIETFSSVFGMYPFANEKYGHCMAPIGGGMEHQTMTTIGPKSAITFNIVAHELAHQWFGDYVTCGSWSDIWLNEGFASYSEYIANERWSNGSPVTWMSSTMAGAKNAWGWVQVHDTLSTSTLFNSSATYNKGAVILHMLRYEINNDSLFFEGIRRYLDTHKYSVAYSNDFQTEMEKISGKNLSFFFDQWLRGLGFPVFVGKWNQINNKVYIHLKQSTTNITTPLFKTTIDIRMVHFTGDTVIRVWVDSLSKVLVFDMGNKTVNTVQIDAAEHILNNVDSIYKDPLFTAIDDVRFSEKEIIFYPNPAKEMLNITNAGGCELEVIDITGRVQFHLLAGENIQSLDLQGMARGIYFIRVSKNGFNTTRKFIKE